MGIDHGDAVLRDMQRLQACPRFGEHGLMEGCALCDPSKVPMPLPMKVPVEFVNDLDGGGGQS